MSQIDSYRNNLLHKKEELAKLNQDLAKEQAKLVPLQSKIIAAQNVIKRTKNQSTIKARLGDIDRSNKATADIQKKIAAILKKIAGKEKEISTAEKNYRMEEARVQKKQEAEEKKRTQAAYHKSQQLEQRMDYSERMQEKMIRDIDRLQSIPKTITVLFLAANPANTEKLGLDEEARAIQQKIRMSQYRDSVRFESRWATRSSELLQAINETNPTIVHFSGHGTLDGDIVLLNPDGSAKLVSKEAISMAMTTATDTIRLVVFNACFSEAQAENVVENIDAAIGMSSSIGDEAACVFAAQLYSAIGFGKSLQVAFNQAIAQLMLSGINEESTPRLYVKEAMSANDIILVNPN